MAENKDGVKGKSGPQESLVISSQSLVFIWCTILVEESHGQAHVNKSRCRGQSAWKYLQTKEPNLKQGSSVEQCRRLVGDKERWVRQRRAAEMREVWIHRMAESSWDKEYRSRCVKEVKSKSWLGMLSLQSPLSACMAWAQKKDLDRWVNSYSQLSMWTLPSVDEMRGWTKNKDRDSFRKSPSIFWKLLIAATGPGEKQEKTVLPRWYHWLFSLHPSALNLKQPTGDS